MLPRPLSSSVLAAPPTASPTIPRAMPASSSCSPRPRRRGLAPPSTSSAKPPRRRRGIGRTAGGRAGGYEAALCAALHAAGRTWSVIHALAGTAFCQCQMRARQDRRDRRPRARRLWRSPRARAAAAARRRADRRRRRDESARPTRAASPRHRPGRRRRAPGAPARARHPARGRSRRAGRPGTLQPRPRPMERHPAHFAADAPRCAARSTWRP